jgi:hypothetical protein
MKKIKVLANFLEVEVDELNQTTYDENTFEYGNQEYLVLAENERDEAVKEYIKETIWAFNPSFLASETELPEEVFKALSDKCESANAPILKLVEKTCGLDDFVSDAVDADGYGHFLSQYDGEENEESLMNQETNKREYYYIYRQN